MICLYYYNNNYLFIHLFIDLLAVAIGITDADRQTLTLSVCLANNTPILSLT